MFPANFLSPIKFLIYKLALVLILILRCHFCLINGRRKKETRRTETRETDNWEPLPVWQNGLNGATACRSLTSQLQPPHLTQFLSSRCHETILSTSPSYLSLFLSGYSLRLFPLLRAFARLFSLVIHPASAGLISFHAKRMQDRVVVAGNERQYR